MHITFICTGNVCRSPMAEGIARKIAEEKYSGKFTFSSAGTDTLCGFAASPEAIDACNEIGIDISSHRSSYITHDLTEQTDLFVVMTQAHANIMRYCDVDEKKVKILGDGIPDPYGGDIVVYRRCRDSMIPLIERLLADCASKENEVNE